MSKTVVFKTWIVKFKDDDSPTGDLSRDILSDKDFPKSNEKDDIVRHLRSKKACADAIKTFELAWQAYLNTR